MELFTSSGEWEAPTLFGSLERANLNLFFKEPNKVGASHSPEDGNRFSLRNVVSSSF
jgi:hypothetical protein